MIRSLAVLRWLFATPLAAQQLEIHFLNVGQGDAAIIQEGGRTAVIDAGTTTGIGAYLQSLHIDTIDLVVASHPHADHIGGMPALFQSVVVRFHLDNGVPYTTGVYRQTMTAVCASGAQYLNATDRTITLGTAQLRDRALCGGSDRAVDRGAGQRLRPDGRNAGGGAARMIA